MKSTNIVRSMVIAVLVMAIGFSMAACTGPEGPAGADGKDAIDGMDLEGLTGPQGIDGAPGLVWKGEANDFNDFVLKYGEPKAGWAFFSWEMKRSFIYNGENKSWELLSLSGTDGKDGEDGKSVYIKGTVANAAALPMTGNNPEGGLQPAYITANDGHLHVWNGTAWTDVGEIRGPEGPQGAQGPQGSTGPTGPAGPAGSASYSITFIGNSNKMQEEATKVNFQVHFDGNPVPSWVMSGAAAVSGFDSYFPIEDVPVPVRFGYTFEGWYLNKACTGAQWDRKITGDAVLYAKWDFVKMMPVAGGSYIQGDIAAQQANAQFAAMRAVSNFSMGQYVVTQEQYERVTGRNPSSNKSSKRNPVQNINWYDAVEFCNQLSEYEALTPVYTITGRTPVTGNPITSMTVAVNWNADGYRLPTECEWEYAAKDGPSKGTTVSLYTTYAGSNTMNDVAWTTENAGGVIREVGLLAPNGLGLYDMSGGVFEMCWDWYGANYYTDTTGGNTDRRGPTSGTNRVERGGGFSYTMEYVDYNRVYARGDVAPGNIAAYRGIRVVRRAD